MKAIKSERERKKKGKKDSIKVFRKEREEKWVTHTKT